MNQLTKKNILFSILFTAILTPMIFFVMGLPMILQIKGFDASLIGIFQLAGLPMIFKFLMSPPIDKIVFEKKHYKKWTFYIGILYILLLTIISFLSLENSIYPVFIAILITAFISTFMDIPLNALAIKTFTKEQSLSAGSYKISAYSMASLLGGGIFLLVFNHLGWNLTFILMALLVLFSLVALYFIEENDEIIYLERISSKNIITFFKQKDIGIWIFILSFYFVSISALWVFMKPYLIHKGVKPDDVAIWVGIYGSFIAILGGALSNYIGKKFSKKNLLIIFMFFNIFSTSLLIFIEQYNLTFYYLIISVTFIALAIALSSAIIFSMIMDYSRKESRAIDYSVQSSIFSFTRIISAVIAGIIVSNFGFDKMFIFELFCLVLVTFVIYKKYI
ncbi:major facilitator superfamily transporter, AmpG-related permease [Aliarcobacter butzleri 7h1h]|uniref:MFS transporter n=1 Tax=Aliarcobacter butzleri L352 TaxID=1447260 RepID=A0A837J9K8_9BACT|nr:MFS transporter [Aliarcobacter butzleri]AGR76656.1 major facilitator superfamily transporter, AmpG-related permease [Aliarcobacter butzleri 7h1h]KLE03191.1 MFS transporter [Aliarcobacter butzleri L352]KLE07705.1 MFS transporter [Aliarcobacter butzleri L354]MCG3693984.1 MFS transporter [Aliarcobacter butzleri]MDN5072238.1 MFS transporter [Aliarcobacter butzleri]